MILGLLLGNTSLRFGAFDGTQVVAAESVLWDECYPNQRKAYSPECPELARFLERFSFVEAVAGSVRDERIDTIERALPSALRPLKIIRRDFPLPLENRYEPPQDVGTDRLLNALAARERTAGQKGAVIVDFGTAISVSVVSPDGAFLGGLISAGVTSLLRGLATATPRLPSVIASFPGAGPPRTFLEGSTEAAVRSGTFWQIVGGVRCTLAGLEAELPFTPKVFATGGDAAAFAPQLPEIEEVVAELTLEGLALAWARR